MPDSLLKPGLSLGPYPQRLDHWPDELEQWLRRVFDWLAVLGKGRQISVATLAQQVDQAAAGFNAYSDAQLDNTIAQLRTRLCQRGLCQELIIEAFAVIREAAVRSLGKRFHDVQLLGGWTMLSGTIAEMETGQGKTFTTTLPACTAALAGIPVHVITANDYLARRDQEALAPLYRRLGLDSGILYDGQANVERQQAYQTAIVHGSGPQFAFDYLRDRLAMGVDSSPHQLQLKQLLARRSGTSSPLLLRGLCFAIVDEIDSVLIDEARTPLIISRQRQSSDEQKQTIDALYLARALSEKTDFQLLPERRSVHLTEVGKERLSQLSKDLDEFWQRRRNREFQAELALQALYLYQRDEHYIVRDQRVMIVDPLTGRVMPDRSWEQGLHQLLEAKEGVEISGLRDPQARITYQNFFRRYLFLTGMSGTVAEARGEFKRVYNLRFRRIPTHQPSQRRYLAEQVFTQTETLRQALLEQVAENHRQGRPVLIGTRSIAESQLCSQWLASRQLPHQVLNAHQDANEANIIAGAGLRGAITIATNMAGRGTDIALGPRVAERGGLQVISIGRNSSRRVDRQLFGRCARQGDPGAVMALNSLQDAQITEFYPAAILNLVKSAVALHRPLPAFLGSWLVRLPQWRREAKERSERRALIQHNRLLSRVLAIDGRGE